MNDLKLYETQEEDGLNQALEAMYFGFRAIIAKPDELLATLNLSRIHHRMLYFIARNEDMSVKALLEKLGVTKQYLHQPMRKLMNESYLQTTPDETDRRIKRLSLTAKGKVLEEQLSRLQRNQFKQVFTEVGSEAEHHWKQVMNMLVQTK